MPESIKDYAMHDFHPCRHPLLMIRFGLGLCDGPLRFQVKRAHNHTELKNFDRTTVG
jgi:hypothetical protein